MLDETEFLSDYGVRSLSKQHRDEPYVFRLDGYEAAVRYEPAESTLRMFGGNSNWRGPIWLPINYLLIQSLVRFHRYYGDEFQIECPSGSGRFTTIAGAADEIARRLIRLFQKDEGGQRAAFGDDRRMQEDPHFRDHLLFHEYFDGDTGKGLGAAHQTGWTGLVANLIEREAGGVAVLAPTTATVPGASASAKTR
jgi:hypothetical protein